MARACKYVYALLALLKKFLPAELRYFRRCSDIRMRGQNFLDCCLRRAYGANSDDKKVFFLLRLVLGGYVDPVEVTIRRTTGGVVAELSTGQTLLYAGGVRSCHPRLSLSANSGA